MAGDPGANFGATAPLEYETTSEVGHPHWEVSYGVRVMVDNRDLGDHSMG